MVIFHRKILRNAVEIITSDQWDHCLPPRMLPSQPPMPLPPTPQSLSNISLSAFVIIMCGLAVSFSFIYYFIFEAWSRYRRRQRNHHNIWSSGTVGLDKSQIESINVFKYKKDEKLIEGTDCSICLNEFEDDESLRLLPNCSHAFHVPCIDTWLWSHKNCPMCRAPIIKNTDDQSGHTVTESTSEETETPVDDSGTSEDNHVAEAENDGEIVKTSGTADETSIG